MTKAELLKKDWQLLTAYSNISTLSKLDTILENQAVIIAHIQNIPIVQTFLIFVQMFSFFSFSDS